jgi:hypothetical protein
MDKSADMMHVIRKPMNQMYTLTDKLHLGACHCQGELGTIVHLPGLAYAEHCPGLLAPAVDSKRHIVGYVSYSSERLEERF